MRLRAQWRRARWQFLRWWVRRSPSTRSLPGFVWRAVLNFAGYGARQAASLSYYAVFSVFPLALLLAITVNRIVGPVIAQEQIRLGLEPFLPPSASETLQLFQTNIAQALEQGSSLGIIAVIGLIWSGLGLFSNITWSLDFIFRVPSNRSLWHQRLTALIMALVLVALLATSFVTSGVLRLSSALLLERPSVWITIGAYFLPFSLNMVIFALLFRFVPARRVQWDAIWPAAIFGAIGWEIAKVLFGWFLANAANFQFIYGALSAGIVLLFWAYLIASIFLFSAELCAQLNQWHIERDQTKTERP